MVDLVTWWVCVVVLMLITWDLFVVHVMLDLLVVGFCSSLAYALGAMLIDAI